MLALDYVLGIQWWTKSDPESTFKELLWAVGENDIDKIITWIDFYKFWSELHRRESARRTYKMRVKKSGKSPWRSNGSSVSWKMSVNIQYRENGICEYRRIFYACSLVSSHPPTPQPAPTYGVFHFHHSGIEVHVISFMDIFFFFFFSCFFFWLSLSI